MSALCHTSQAFWNGALELHLSFSLSTLSEQEPVLELFLFSFCHEPRYDTNTTGCVHPRFLSSRFELVDERIPPGIAGGQPVPKYVSIDDMSELAMYSLPPVQKISKRAASMDRKTDIP